MRFSTALGVSAALIPFASATPTDFDINEREQSIKQIPQTVKGEDKEKLHKAPSTLSSGTTDFLKKYQHYSDDAAKVVPSHDQITFSSEGQCYAEYPCFSVNKAEKVSIKSSDGKSVPEISEEQMAKLLDAIVKHKNTHFDESNPNSPWGGLKHADQEAVLEIIGPKGTVPSNEAAGMVFDTYKLQAGDDSANAVRAVIAQPDNGPKPQIAFCLYPKSVDKDAVKNFCIGKELDGSSPHKQNARNVDTSHLPQEIREKWEKLKQSIPGLGGDETHPVQARDPKGGSGGGGKPSGASNAANQAGNAASVVSAGVGADNLACKFGNIPLICPNARRSLDSLEARNPEDPDEWLDDKQDLSARDPEIKGQGDVPGSGLGSPHVLDDWYNHHTSPLPHPGIITRDPKGGSGGGGKGGAVSSAANHAGTGASVVSAGVGADNIACKFADIPIVCPRSMETLEDLHSLDRRSPKGGSGGGAKGGAAGSAANHVGTGASVVSAGVGADNLACKFGDIPFLCPRSIETTHDDFADLVARDPKGGSGGGGKPSGAGNAANQAGNAASVVSAGVGADNLACKFGHIPVICPRNIEVPHEHLSSLVARDPKGGSGGGGKPSGDKPKDDKPSGASNAANQAGNAASVVSAGVGADNLACKFGHIPVICPRTVEMPHEDFAELVARSPKGGSGGGKPSGAGVGNAVGTGASAVSGAVSADNFACKHFDIPIVCPDKQ